jgi:4-amino-4-deoxy-L-arabinose transferase-like glycosyltransferase
MKLAHAEWLFIVALLLLAVVLRFTGLTYGQPDPRYDHSGIDQGLINVNTPIHPDEFLFITRPLQMLLTRQYNPKFFHNPSFLNNANFVTFWLTDVGNGLSQEDRKGVNGRSYAPFHLYIIGRTYSALGGILAVAATYAATRRIGGRFAACAGLVVAVSFPMVQHAHYTTTSSLAAGFTAVAVWASFASLHSKHRWMFWLAGIAAGLAAGNRYNTSLVGIVVFLVGLVLLYRDSSWKMRRTVLIGWLLVPVTFVFTTPWIIFDTAFFLDELRYILSQYLTGLDIQFTTPYGLWFEYRYLITFGLGVPATLALLLGLYAAWRTRPRQGNFLRQNSALLCVLILLVYLVIYSLVNLRTARPALSDQMLVPVIPQFALIAGLGACWLYERLPIPKRVLAPVLALSLVIIPIVPSLQLVRQFTQPDTREIMQPSAAWLAHSLTWPL